MDVYEAIDSRRTIRAFSKGVSEEQLRKMISAGINAPSGSNVQPWAFIVVEDPRTIAKVAEHKYRQSLKMVIDDAVLNDPPVVEQIYQQSLEKPLSSRMPEAQRDVYRDCTVIAVCNQKGHGIGRKPWMNVENIASSWMCIQNMALAATADGLGVVPSVFREEYKIAVEELLGIPEDYELTAMLLIGVQARRLTRRAPGVRERSLRLYKNRFGSR